MKWLKRVVTGVLAVFITASVVPMSLCTYFQWRLEKSGRTNEVIGIDPVGIIGLSLTWMVLGLAFAAGFLWEYRWLKEKPRTSNAEVRATADRHRGSPHGSVQPSGLLGEHRVLGVFGVEFVHQF
jgi:hypothetical protein